jgi:hypothetical protein
MHRLAVRAADPYRNPFRNIPSADHSGMPDRSEKRVLFVSYLFPPAGGVGALRVSKFVKCLPDYGWKCSVLTASNPSAPLIDDALEGDVPGDTLVRRARTLDPGGGEEYALSSRSGRRGPLDWCRHVAYRAATSFLAPDPQVLWRPCAMRAGLRLLREVRHDAIIATGPPFSSLVLGAALSRKSGVPLVLNYRNEWDITSNDRETGGPWKWTLRMQRAMQRSAIRQARALLATSPSSALHLARTADQCGCRVQATWIYNGFDQDDFPPPPSVTRPRTDYGHGTHLYRISFVGTLWDLSPIGPFVSGVQKLTRERPELAERLELVVTGRRTETQERELDRLQGLPCKLVRLPFVPHDEAIRIMRESDSLLLLNADRPDTHRIVNAKTFEYMAAGRPIFTVAPDGDLWAVVRDLPGTVLCQPCAEGAIAEALAGNIERHTTRRGDLPADRDITQYEQRHLAGELAVLLDDVVSDATDPTAAERPPAHTAGGAV